MATDESDQCVFLDSVFGFMFSGIVGPFVTIVALIYLFKELTMGICNCTKELHGKVAIVTGANSGICQLTTLQRPKFEKTLRALDKRLIPVS